MTRHKHPNKVFHVLSAFDPEGQYLAECRCSDGSIARHVNIDDIRAQYNEDIIEEEVKEREDSKQLKLEL